MTHWFRVAAVHTRDFNLDGYQNEEQLSHLSLGQLKKTIFLWPHLYIIIFNVIFVV